jgi:hypothetical protein
MIYPFCSFNAAYVARSQKEVRRGLSRSGDSGVRLERTDRRHHM